MRRLKGRYTEGPKDDGDEMTDTQQTVPLTAAEIAAALQSAQAIIREDARTEEPVHAAEDCIRVARALLATVQRLEVAEADRDRHLKSFQSSGEWLCRIWKALGMAKKPRLTELVEYASSLRQQLAQRDAELTEAKRDLDLRSKYTADVVANGGCPTEGRSTAGAIIRGRLRHGSGG